MKSYKELSRLAKKDKYDLCAIEYAFKYSCIIGYSNIVYRLLEDEFKPTSEYLYLACENDNYTIVSLILEKGYEPEEEHLLIASEKGHYLIVKKLLTYNPHINKNNALLKAVSYNHPKIVRILMDYGAKPSDMCYIISEQYESKEILELLNKS